MSQSQTVHDSNFKETSRETRYWNYRNRIRTTTILILLWLTGMWNLWILRTLFKYGKIEPGYEEAVDFDNTS